MTQTEFHHAKPVYEYFDGWWEDISGCRTFDDLPKNAQAYVRALEEMSGTPYLGRRRRPGPRADARGPAAGSGGGTVRAMLDPRDAIDRINARSTAATRTIARSTHAAPSTPGTFTATPEATAPVPGRAVSRDAGAGAGALVQRRAATPDRPDQAPDVRGMAVKFQAPGRRHRPARPDLAAVPDADPEDFVSMAEAAAHQADLPAVDGPPSRARSRRSLAGIARQVARPAVLLRRDPLLPDPRLRLGRRRRPPTWVRYVLQPLGGRGRAAGRATFEGPDRLTRRDRRPAGRGPGRYDLHVTVAGAGDDPHDPTSVWTGAARAERRRDRGDGAGRRPGAVRRVRWCSTRPGSSTASSSPTTRSCATAPAAYGESIDASYVLIPRLDRGRQPRSSRPPIARRTLGP